MTAADVLELLKTDLGITITKRDAYLSALIESCKGELERRGIAIDIGTAETDDIFLLSDYAAWSYRSRIEGTPMPENLVLRIRNRIIRNRAGGEDQDE